MAPSRWVGTLLLCECLQGQPSLWGPLSLGVRCRGIVYANNRGLRAGVVERIRCFCLRSQTFYHAGQGPHRPPALQSPCNQCCVVKRPSTRAAPSASNSAHGRSHTSRTPTRGCTCLRAPPSWTTCAAPTARKSRVRRVHTCGGFSKQCTLWITPPGPARRRRCCHRSRAAECDACKERPCHRGGALINTGERDALARSPHTLIAFFVRQRRSCIPILFRSLVDPPPDCCTLRPAGLSALTPGTVCRPMRFARSRSQTERSHCTRAWTSPCFVWGDVGRPPLASTWDGLQLPRESHNCPRVYEIACVCLRIEDQVPCSWAQWHVNSFSTNNPKLVQYCKGL